MKNMIEQSEHISRYIFPEHRSYILPTLKKFRPQNFDKGKMNTEKIWAMIIQKI